MKSCSKCKIEKRNKDFYKNKSGKLRSVCIPCELEYRRTVGKIKQLKKRYNLTLEEYNNIFATQAGSCAICGIHQSLLFCALAVDHDHETKEVRGLLCYNCNSGLGRFKDNIELLDKAKKYLMRSIDLQHTSPSCPR